VADRFDATNFIRSILEITINVTVLRVDLIREWRRLRNVTGDGV
jgi:hypothetical protein